MELAPLSFTRDRRCRRRRGARHGMRSITEIDPMTLQPANSEAERRALQEETAPLFAQRVHGGLCILLVAFAIFTPDVMWHDPSALLPLYGAKLIQLGTILLAFVVLRF